MNADPASPASPNDAARLVIRAADPADAEAVARLAAEAFAASGDAWSPSLYASEVSRGGRVWVAVAEPEGVIGYLVRSGGDPDELLQIAVQPSHRRHGVGRRLLAAACGTRPLWLEVRADNHGARAFYRRLGFTETGRRERYYPDGTDAILLGSDPVS